MCPPGCASMRQASSSYCCCFTQYQCVGRLSGASSCASALQVLKSLLVLQFPGSQRSFFEIVYHHSALHTQLYCNLSILVLYAGVHFHLCWFSPSSLDGGINFQSGSSFWSPFENHSYCHHVLALLLSGLHPPSLIAGHAPYCFDVLFEVINLLPL